MSYKNKLSNYQNDCYVLLGKYPLFSDYIKEFSKGRIGDGLDIGAGPMGPNGKFFVDANNLDGCDADEDIVQTLPKNVYSKTFQYLLGSQNLPYENSSKDFIICSCVIQHLKSFTELENGIKEISRVMKEGGQFYLMFKTGTNDTNLTHFNSYYSEERTFRVFEPKNVTELCKRNDLEMVKTETLLDDNWIPYSCIIFKKV